MPTKQKTRLIIWLDIALPVEKVGDKERVILSRSIWSALSVFLDYTSELNLYLKQVK